MKYRVTGRNLQARREGLAAPLIDVSYDAADQYGAWCQFKKDYPNCSALTILPMEVKL
jgi:hypothetical protein